MLNMSFGRKMGSKPLGEVGWVFVWLRGESSLKSGLFHKARHLLPGRRC